jgi:hypothetical protein
LQSERCTIEGLNVNEGNASGWGCARVKRHLDGCIEMALANPAPGSYNVTDDGHGNAFSGGRHEFRSQ